MSKKKTKKSWYSFTALSPSETEIVIYDEIGDSFWGESVTAKDFIAELTKINSVNITLRINSPGGSVFDANAMYNAIKQHPAHVTGVVDGVAASAASVVLMAADEINIPANAMIMIHSPWSFADGNAEELREQADTLDKVQATMVVAYKRSGMSEDEINSIMAAETWYNANEAVEAGFADKIIDVVEPQARQRKVFASLKRYKNTPNQYEVKSMGAEQEKGVEPEKKEVVPVPAAKVEPVQEPKVQATPQAAGVADMQREQERVKEVRAYADNFGVAIDSDWIDDNTYTGEKLRKAVAKAFKAESKPLGGGGGRSSVGDDPVDKIQDPMIHGIMARAGFSPMMEDDTGQAVRKPLAKGYKAFQKMPLIRLATQYAAAQGFTGMSRMSDEEIAMEMLSGKTVKSRGDSMSMRAAVTVDDFPTLLNVVVNQVLQSYMLTQEREWQPAVKVIQANDFRERVVKRLKMDGLLGETSHIDKFPLMQFETTGESWKINMQGIRFVITLEGMLGDDFGAFLDVPMAMQRGQFESERLKFYDFLDDTTVMSDGLPLFHADHGNLATVDATRGDLATFQAAFHQANIRMMNQSETVKGNTPIRLRARMQNVFCNVLDEEEISTMANNATISDVDIPGGKKNRWYGTPYISWLFGEQALRIQSRTTYTGLTTETVGWTAFGMGRVGHIGIDKTVVSAA